MGAVKVVIIVTIQIIKKLIISNEGGLCAQSKKENKGLFFVARNTELSGG